MITSLVSTILLICVVLAIVIYKITRPPTTTQETNKKILQQEIKSFMHKPESKKKKTDFKLIETKLLTGTTIFCYQGNIEYSSSRIMKKEILLPIYG